MVTRAQLERFIEGADSVNHVARTLLTVVSETGHRISAVLGRRWTDVDLEGRRVRWRAELDKIGYEHETPLSETATSALKDWRRTDSAVGDTPVFPADRDQSKPMPRHFARDLWQKLEKAAGLPPESLRGWHSLRRTFANELRAAPQRDLVALGGWKEPQTVVKTYQQASLETMRQALSQRQRIG
jgi:integrase